MMLSTWDADLAFTRDVGLSFVGIYPHIVARNISHALDGG